MQRLKQFNRDHPIFLRAPVGIVLYILLGFALWWYISPNPEDVSQKKEFAQLMAQIAGGVALLFGLYFTWRRVEISQRALESQQDQQWITERFTQAIDQLGATDDNGEKKLEIRLGGIYALERIARDSERDHWPIMEILTTYVREHASWPPKKRSGEGGFLFLMSLRGLWGRASNKPDDRPEPKFPAPDPDIQAILTVLGRCTHHFGDGEVERIDLHKANLRRADLRAAHLEGAHLEEVHLEEAKLIGARLEGAILREAHLEEANLREARLEGAHLGAAHLMGANLIGARLEGARLGAAHLMGADLGEAYLRGANLIVAHLEGAILRKAHLERAALWEARLEGAHLGAAHLMGANLIGAHLEGADLGKAYLRGANLIGAHLKGAQYLTQEQIEQAIGDKTTELPEGLTLPASWTTSTDAQEK